MHVSGPLAQEIRSYIKNVLSQDVVIIDSNGTGLPTADGTSEDVHIPKDSLQRTDIATIDVNGRPRLLIPLKYQSETVGGLILENSAQDLTTYVPLIKSFAELLVQQYAVVNQPVLDSTDQFISKLIFHATPNDLPFYESEANVLGYNTKARRLAIVIHLKDFWEKCLASADQASFDREEVIKDWKRNIENKMGDFFSKSSENITAYIGQNTFVVFKAIAAGDDEQNTIKLLKKSHQAIFNPLKNFSISDIVVGVGNPSEGLQGMIDSYREANLALEFGSRLWGDNRTYFFGDLGILTILGEGNRQKEMQFANQLLQQLSNKDLVDTLECFFEENLNLTETANRMGIHRNTVIYRLNQISNILGVDPRIFEQAMTIKIALLIKKLFG